MMNQRKEKAAPFRVEQFGMMVNAYLKKAGLRRTKGEKEIAGNIKLLKALSGVADTDKRKFAAELRKIGDKKGAAAVEGGMGKGEWQKFWTRERVEAFRKSRKKRK